MRVALFLTTVFFVSVSFAQAKRFEITNAENGMKFQVEADSLKPQPEYGANPIIIEIDLASEHDAAKKTQEAKKERQTEIKTLAEKSGNLTAAEIQRLLKALAQEVRE